MTQLMTKAEYARHRGVSGAAVTKAIERCRIPLVDGKIDPLVADTLWRARTDPHQQRRALQQNLREPDQSIDVPPDEPAAPKIGSWRDRRDKAEAQLAELELAQQLGSLVKADDVERKARQLASAIVQQFEAVPDRIAAELGTDPAHRSKLRTRLREELDRVRAEIARAGLTAEQ